jgi:ATP-binding cassette subfamily B protein
MRAPTASGSGKSTLVHLVARLWDVAPDQGAIRIGGVDIRSLPFELLHRSIAMVFQDVVLFSGSVFENIRVGRPDATRAAVMEAAKAAHAHEFIAGMSQGYDTQLGPGGESLSGGERQRISIARAILKDAPVVLLDEATASVDASAECEIQHAIDRLVQHKTVVLIAHRLRTIQRAHRIVVLERGQVVESGTHDELLAQCGSYARMWNEQERAGAQPLDSGRQAVAVRVVQPVGEPPGCFLDLHLDDTLDLAFPEGDAGIQLRRDFTQTVLTTRERGEVYRWPTVAGLRHVL